MLGICVAALLRSQQEPGPPRQPRKPDAGYGCMAAYPSPADSLKLGRQNVHLFRLKNTRFDTIGGVIYFLLVVRAAHLASPVSMPGFTTVCPLHLLLSMPRLQRPPFV